MTHTYIKFESQTLGEKAKRLLRDRGIKATLKRNPNPNRKEGCNFALFIQGNVWQAYDIIMRSEIRNLGVESYREGL
ncbi:MAG: hypothetical protein IKB94_07135 [Clostridia bacterium]|nr:hypothetical protein [Clostridia bacterium]MBR2893612.1 hypothetical protein [Clostridia bacterium]